MDRLQGAFGPSFQRVEEKEDQIYRLDGGENADIADSL